MSLWNRTPAFSEDIGSTEIGGEDEGVKPLERSFWAKYVSRQNMLSQIYLSLHFSVTAKTKSQQTLN